MSKDSNSSRMIQVARAQAPLAIIWTVGVSVVFIVFAAQTMNGRFGDEESTRAAWEWLAGWLAPGASVVLGGLAAGASGLIDPPQRGVRPVLFGIAVWFSALYLAGILVVVMWASFIDGGPFVAYELANTPLSFAQSITLFIVTLFFSRKEQGNTAPLAPTVAAE